MRWSRRSAPSPVPAPGLPGTDRSREGQRAGEPDRPVRHRLLLGLHGGGSRRRDLAPGRDRRGVAVVVGRQRHLHGGAGAARRGARRAAPASSSISWRTPSPTPSASRWSGSSRRSPATCRCRSRSSRSPARSRRRSPTAPPCGPSRRPRSPPPTTPISTAASPASSTSPRSPSISGPKAATNTPPSLFVPGIAAVRSVRSRPQGAHQALRQARIHHRRGRDPAALPALRARRSSIPPTCRSTSRAR